MIGSVNAQVLYPPTTQISSVIRHPESHNRYMSDHLPESFFCVSSAIGSTPSIGRSAVVPVSAQLCQAWACKAKSGYIQNESTGRRETGH